MSPSLSVTVVGITVKVGTCDSLEPNTIGSRSGGRDVRRRGHCIRRERVRYVNRKEVKLDLYK